jgi:NitT/TauT family transport system substrate-binding protein
MRTIGSIKSLMVAVATFMALPLASSQAEDLKEIKIALSAFQNVNSIYVGIAKGFYAEEGLKLSIQTTDWPSANELLIGENVDLATSSDADIVLQNARGVDTTLAFPLFYFAGGGLMYDPKKFKWKTLDQLLPAAGGDITEGIKQALIQAKGARVGVSSGGAEYASFVQMLTVAGLKPSDYTIVDLSQEELPPALIAGSIDIMISGIPQRIAMLKQGYQTLMDQTAVPSTVAHAGFAAHRAWVDKNFDTAVKMEKVILKTLDYCNKNKDDCFAIIADNMRREGTDLTVADLKTEWNIMEFFPDSKKWFQDKVEAENGQFYWKSRLQTVVTNLQAQGRIKDFATPLPDLYYGLKVIDAMKD